MNEKFERVELLVTPGLMVLAMAVMYLTVPRILPGEEFTTVWFAPLLLGHAIGVAVVILMDRTWLEVSAPVMGRFLRPPVFGLLLIATGATALINVDVFVALALMGVGLGAMVTVVITASLLGYHRTYGRGKKSGPELIPVRTSE